MTTDTRKSVICARIGCLVLGVSALSYIYLISIGAFTPNKYRLFRKAAQKAKYKAMCAKCGVIPVDSIEPYRIVKYGWCIPPTAVRLVAG